MTTRAEVYAALDSERAYQESRWPGSGEKPGDPRWHEIDAWITYIAAYTTTLVHHGATSEDKKVKLDFIRKVAALGVAAMEQHGAPRREGF